MPITVIFKYNTGIKPRLFSNARLVGSWDTNGRYSDQWSSKSMHLTVGDDGCDSFVAEMQFDEAQTGWSFHWGVYLDTAGKEGFWAIPTEVNEPDSRDRTRTFTLAIPDGIVTQQEKYYLNESRRLGAQKFYKSGETEPSIRFSAWAPNAQTMEVVMSYTWDGMGNDESPSTNLELSPAMVPIYRDRIMGGYISNSGEGVHPQWGPFQMSRNALGIWSTDVNDHLLASFRHFDHAPYMFRVVKDNGEVVYRSDIYSRCQIGYGNFVPDAAYKGSVSNLDGVRSCSVVVDPDLVVKHQDDPLWPERDWLAATDFWEEENSFPSRPTQIKDLVIYELHVGALGFGKSNNEPGTLRDAVLLLDHLAELGINAIELLPMSEFGGGVGGWGYATSHYFAIEYSGGGRDQYKWFVKECHRRGISVLLDVVYNHYNHNAERAEWMYDTSWHDKNPYYWYVGKPWDYAEFNSQVDDSRKGTGGYLDNYSTAWAPRYHEEQVRKMFISSAVALAVEFNIDGFRIDQTTSIHDYNSLHANGERYEEANKFGKKLLRELTRTLKMVKPEIIITAEDHSNSPEVTNLTESGGMGIDAVWYADFYHHLIGDTDKGVDYAKLLKTAGKGDNIALAFNYFEGALRNSAFSKIVYHESHDEAGNYDDDKAPFTDRTIRVAMGMSPADKGPLPLDATWRRYGEARCRFVAGITMLSAGTPMFLFGEEVGADKKYRYGKVLESRENLEYLKKNSGRLLFLFYQEIIRFRKDVPAIKSNNIEIVYVSNRDRLLVFRRWADDQHYLIIASLSNNAFNRPSYNITSDKIEAAKWLEVFNSDLERFGGFNVGNFSSEIQSFPGVMSCIIPANGFIVLKRVNG